MRPRTRSSSARVGNIYVNRNIIGAVVGVQPFGGQGLSGTGPKAGGPLYLQRLLSRAPPLHWPQAIAARAPEALRGLIDWLAVDREPTLGSIDRQYLRVRAERYARRTLLGARLKLRGY